MLKHNKAALHPRGQRAASTFQILLNYDCCKDTIKKRDYKTASPFSVVFILNIGFDGFNGFFILSTDYTDYTDFFAFFCVFCCFYLTTNFTNYTNISVISVICCFFFNIGFHGLNGCCKRNLCNLCHPLKTKKT